VHGYLAVAHGADHDGRHLGVDEVDLSGELDHLVEQRIGARNSGARCHSCQRNHGGARPQNRE
jgi:hypothetical protein